MTQSEIRSALAELGREPSRSLGQNFLHDQNLCRAIVRQIDPAPGETVVEIGPGLGALTEPLVETDAEVLALEKDQILAARLQRVFAGRLDVVAGDALDFDLRPLWPRQPVKILGNLPYYVSSQLIFHFCSELSPARRALFLVQREMAERLCAAPGSAEYGLPTVLLGRRWRMTRGRLLPAGVFHPAPKVESALIDFAPRGPGELPVCDATVFERAARAGFSQRRKQLRKLLTAEFPELDWASVRAAAGATDTVRAEELALEQWIALTNALAPVGAAQDVHGEMFDVVDAEDRVIDRRSRGEVHARNLWHRAIHLLLTNRKGEVFLQKRSLAKDQNPGAWGSSAAGHVDAGEDYAAAARREIREELGLEADAVALREAARLPPTEGNGWEFVRVFRAEAEGPFRYPASEVETGAFFPPEVVGEWLRRRPQDFTPAFQECWAAVMA